MLRPFYFQLMNDNILSVSQLNQAVADLLEAEFAWVSVEGEISNLARPASGHIYFSLKDDSAQVRCAMFRSRMRGLDFQPENGMQVQLRAKVSLYQARGDYQLIVDRLEEAGAGRLQQQFEALKRKLASEGLFDEDSKQEVPEHARGIAVITSRSGAAVRDVISVIRRRFPAIPVHLYPVTVQGDTSAGEICHALQLADEDKDCDVILLVRGGGSIEDLWSFNEESVARAIHACSTPVVSGVGHEIDITIADFVADLRAATPTAAAEAVTPDQHSWYQDLDWYSQRFERLLNDHLASLQQRLQWLETRLQQQHPVAALRRLRQQVDALGSKLCLLTNTRAQLESARLDRLRDRLLASSPSSKLVLQSQRLEHITGKLRNSMDQRLQQSRMKIANQARVLQTLSPLETLARGYSITLSADGKAVLNSKQISIGDSITTRLSQGKVTSTVDSIEN